MYIYIAISMDKRIFFCLDVIFIHRPIERRAENEHVNINKQSISIIEKNLFACSP